MREATAAGFVVIPVGGPDGKRPVAGKRWQSRGLATEEEMQRWAARTGCCNYGIVTGQLVDVIDVDAGGDEATAEDLVRRVAEALGLPAGWQTRTVATGRGLHLYVRHVPGARSADSIAGVPVEYKAGGRMVVGPGSIHQATGKLYTVVDPAVPIAALPDPASLLAALGPGPSSDPDSPDSGCRPIGPAGLRTSPRRCLTARSGVSAELALARAEAAIAKAQPRQRNTILNRQVYALGPYLAAGELATAEVRRVCGAAARRDRPDGSPGLDPREVVATLAGAIAAGTRDSAPVGSDLGVPERVCEHPARGCAPPATTGRKGYRVLTPCRGEQQLLPQLALIWRVSQATAWPWAGRYEHLDRAVFDLMLGRAQQLCQSLEVEPRVRWLVEQLEGRWPEIRHEHVEASWRRLCEHGWLHLVRQGGPKGEHSPRAPSTFRLAMPQALRSVQPRYPESMVRRLRDGFPMFKAAHQLQELPLQGSWEVFLASKPVRAEVVGPSQEALSPLGEVRPVGEAIENPVLVPGEPGVAGTDALRVKRHRCPRPKKFAPAHSRQVQRWSCGRSVLEPELVAVLELLEAAGLAPEVVGRVNHPPAYRRAQRRNRPRSVQAHSSA